MKKRTKFRKQYKVSPNSHANTLLNSKLMKIEQDILKSHSNERIQNESTAVAKIKDDPNYFYCYAKKFSIVKSDIGPLLDSSGNLTSDKKIICKLLLDQFNTIFSTPSVENRVNDPVSYFTSEMGSLTPQLITLQLTKIRSLRQFTIYLPILHQALMVYLPLFLRNVLKLFQSPL